MEPDELLINWKPLEDYWKSLDCMWGTWKILHLRQRILLPVQPCRENWKLADAKVFVYSAIFPDVLAEAKKFSFLIQKKNINIIKLLNAVESTKSNYEWLLKKIQDSNYYILTLPNFKIIIDAVESNEDEDSEPLNQGH